LRKHSIWLAHFGQAEIRLEDQKVPAVPFEVVGPNSEVHFLAIAGG
jgi:hypothetical protein